MGVITLQEKQALFAKNIGLLIAHIFEMNMSCTFGDAYRSPEQAELNASKGIGIKDSLHCKRLAVDLNIFDSNGKYLTTSTQQYDEIGTYWESLHLNNRWGGKFSRADYNHMEMKNI